MAMKQDRTGYVLTLSLHPDDVPDEILRDFVGARYQVVMVRLGGTDQPMIREQEYAPDPVKIAGILCRDENFHRFLMETGQTMVAKEQATIDWMRNELGIASRAELKTNTEASRHLFTINEEFKAWKRNA